MLRRYEYTKLVYDSFAEVFGGIGEQFQSNPTVPAVCPIKEDGMLCTEHFTLGSVCKLVKKQIMIFLSTLYRLQG